MAKPFLITLPFVLLLLNYWPLQRVGAVDGWRRVPRLIAEKLPLRLEPEHALARANRAELIGARPAAGAAERR